LLLISIDAFVVLLPMKLRWVSFQVSYCEKYPDSPSNHFDLMVLSETELIYDCSKTVCTSLLFEITILFLIFNASISYKWSHPNLHKGITIFGSILSLKEHLDLFFLCAVTKELTLNSFLHIAHDSTSLPSNSHLRKMCCSLRLWLSMSESVPFEQILKEPFKP